MLSNWLLPLNSEVNSNYFNDVYTSKGQFPNLKTAKVVVFSKHYEFCDQVRNSLSNLYNHFETEIIDIGNLSVENIASIYQVVSELQDGKILPVLIGIDNNEFYAMCSALILEKKLYKATFVSNTVGNPNLDFDIENLAYQRHLIPKHNFTDMLENEYQGMSLGMIRSQQRLLEPIIRESSYLHFDLSAIRKSECPNINTSLPTGLYTEEACQIMRYAGESSRLNLISISPIIGTDIYDQEAMIVAELIWYLHEGVEHKIDEHPTLSNSFNKFVVELTESNLSIEFHQSDKSGKWWLQSPQDKNKYFACSIEEYQATIRQDFPDRLMRLI